MDVFCTCNIGTATSQTYLLPFKGYGGKDSVMPRKSYPNPVGILTNFTTSRTFPGISPDKVNIILI